MPALTFWGSSGGIGSKTGESEFLVRHKDPWFVSLINRYFDIEDKEQVVRSRTGEQYQLKVASYSHVQSILGLLSRHGWAERRAPVRPYPKGPLDDRGFVRAWIELHSGSDIAVTGRQRNHISRLRIYGNEALLDSMNLIISENTGLKPRKLQKTVNETTKCLYYYGRSFAALFEWLYCGDVLTNSRVKENFEAVIFG